MQWTVPLSEPLRGIVGSGNRQRNVTWACPFNHINCLPVSIHILPDNNIWYHVLHTHSTFLDYQNKLLHSPSLMVVSLLRVMRHGLQLAADASCMFGSSTYSLGNNSPALNYCLAAIHYEFM